MFVHLSWRGSIAKFASLGCIIAGLTISVACSGQTAVTHDTAAGVDIPPLKLSQQEMDRAERDASPFQRSILSDGEITFSEYQKATFATVQCMERHGLKVAFQSSDDPFAPPSGMVADSRGVYVYFGVPAQNPTPNASGVVVVTQDAGTGCAAQYSSVIQPLWQAYRAPTQRELQRARDAIAACLNRSGHPVPSHPLAAELPKLLGIANGAPVPSWYQTCTIQADQEANTPHYGGE